MELEELTAFAVGRQREAAAIKARFAEKYEALEDKAGGQAMHYLRQVAVWSYVEMAWAELMPAEDAKHDAAVEAEVIAPPA